MICELRPYPGTGDISAILDRIPRFSIIVSREGGYIRIYIRIHKRHLPVLEYIDGMEPVPAESPTLHDMPVCHAYTTIRHCALPIAPREIARQSIYRAMADMAGDGYLMVSAEKRLSHPRISGYIRCMRQGRQPGILSHITSGGRPGPAQDIKIKAAIQKAASRHLFCCEIVSAACDQKGMESIESVFPSMSLKRTKLSQKRLDALWERGPGGTMLDRTIILSDWEICTFLQLPTAEDISSSPMKQGRMPSRSGGGRTTEPDITGIDIGRP